MRSGKRPFRDKTMGNLVALRSTMSGDIWNGSTHILAMSFLDPFVSSGKKVLVTLCTLVTFVEKVLSRSVLSQGRVSSTIAQHEEQALAKLPHRGDERLACSRCH